MTTDELFQKQMVQDQLKQYLKTPVSICFDIRLVGCFWIVGVFHSVPKVCTDFEHFFECKKLLSD